jgi:hypothetical protein
MSWWQLLLVQLGVGGGLAAFLQKSLGEITRGAVDQAVGEALNRQQHEFERQLQQVGLERDRLAGEHGLFAQKRNDAYAEIYRKFAEAAGRAGARAGMTRSPDFDRWTDDRLEEFLLGPAKLTKAEAIIVMSGVRSDRKFGISEVNDIYDRLRLNEADSALTQAQILVEEGAIYLSDDVERRLAELDGSLRTLLIRIRFPDDTPGESSKLLKMKEAMQKDMTALKDAIRLELRRGFEPLSLDKAGQDGTHAMTSGETRGQLLPPSDQPKAIESNK